MEQKARRVKVDGVNAGAANVVPVGGASGFDEQTLRVLSVLLDTAFQVPGTNLRFGLDPLIGLIPVVGDYAVGLISLYLLTLAARYSLPKIVLVRMSLNVMINTVVGSIPVLGDAFIFWFKPNARNYALFQKYAGPQRPSTSGDWLFVAGLIGGMALVLSLALVALFAFLHGLWKIASHIG